MPLEPGTMLGPYRIEEPVGAGGMGEVYRALDTRLDRTVAIKVLSSHLSSRPDLQSRFEREAKTISSLQHPNVCSLFDVGRENGVDFLVMEYLEGQSLAERLLQGPIPIDELLRIAVQITDALDAAHRRGIIHRDLKPGNVMLAKSGVKLLDFGLAKVAEMAGPPPGTLVSGTMPGGLTRPTGSDSLTAEGTILGTFQYMAPEQLEGGEADARTDIFALGALLYEMATGRKAFEGKSQASLIASIMSAKPASISAVQPMAPPALDRVIGTCLQKDPDDRWQTARDVGRELRWIAEGGSDVALPRAVALRRRSRERLAWIAFAGAAAVALALGAVQLTRPKPARPSAMRFTIEGPRGLVSIGSPRLSPDGKFIAFDGTDSVGVKRIWIRPLNDLEAHPLPGTEGTQRPFWSPDSKNIGFIAGAKLKRVPIEGGPPLTLCDTPTGADGNWGTGNLILFDGRTGDSVQVVPAGGGTPGPATRLDRSRHQTVDGWPCFLPDGKHFLYLANFTGAPGEIRLGTIGSLESTKLTTGESRIEVAPGYLIFERSGTLLAQPFDANSAKLTGEAFPLAEGIGTDAVGLAHFSTSQNGMLLYSGGSSHNRQLGWYDREGRLLDQVGEAAYITETALSPDGLKVAATSWDQTGNNYDIWLIDLRRNVQSRFTFAPEADFCPLWSRDGSRVFFSSDRSKGLYVKNAAGTGTEQKFFDIDTLFTGSSLTPDGSTLLGQIRRPGSRWDIASLSLDGKPELTDQITTEFAEYNPMVSPDGRYFAYTSWESGDQEIYISTFPAGGGKWQVSQGGGLEPSWRGDGKELYYLTGDHRLMAVDVTLESAGVEIGAPHLLFHAPLQPPDQERNRYTPSPDGKRFLLSAVPDWDRRPAMTVVLNWAEELKRR
jgi:Tol biopolymer transport system component